MSFHPIKKEIKDQILHRIKNEGVSVSQASKDHGVCAKTIYSWLRSGAASTSISILEVAQLKRENKVLLEMVGRLTMEKQKQSLSSALFSDTLSKSEANGIGGVTS